MRSLAFLARPFIDYVINTTGYPKYRYHLLYPLSLAVMITLCSDKNVIPLVTHGLTALSFIAGFSFAALIAFPSIESPYLNEYIWGNKFFDTKVHKITFCYNDKGHETKIPLRKKMFISLLLGYVCFISTILLLSCIVLLNLNISNFYVNSVVFCVFLTFFISLIINVLYAVQYFTKINFNSNNND